MTSRNIPRYQWRQFFDDFTRRHREAAVSVTVVGETLGAQHEARELPLNGIVADRFGKHISIALGGSPESNVDHPVDRPVRVWIESDGKGNEIAIEIESEGGVQTILELTPNPPQASPVHS